MFFLTLYAMSQEFCSLRTLITCIFNNKLLCSHWDERVIDSTFNLIQVICYRIEPSNIFQAHEVLLAGRKLSAVEACNYGLVTEVFPQAEFETEVNKRMKNLAGLPPNVSLLAHCIGARTITRVALGVRGLCLSPLKPSLVWHFI